MKINNKKVVIVGVGAVGSTYAHNLVVDDLADEIAIINTNKSKASANSLDLLHALPYLNAAPKTFMLLIIQMFLMQILLFYLPMLHQQLSEKIQIAYSY